MIEKNSYLARTWQTFLQNLASQRINLIADSCQLVRFLQDWNYFARFLQDSCKIHVNLQDSSKMYLNLQDSYFKDSCKICLKTSYWTGMEKLLHYLRYHLCLLRNIHEYWPVWGHPLFLPLSPRRGRKQWCGWTHILLWTRRCWRKRPSGPSGCKSGSPARRRHTCTPCARYTVLKKKQLTNLLKVESKHFIFLNAYIS